MSLSISPSFSPSVFVCLRERERNRESDSEVRYSPPSLVEPFPSLLSASWPGRDGRMHHSTLSRGGVHTRSLRRQPFLLKRPAVLSLSLAKTLEQKTTKRLQLRFQSVIVWLCWGGSLSAWLLIYPRRKGKNTRQSGTCSVDMGTWKLINLFHQTRKTTLPLCCDFLAPPSLFPVFWCLVSVLLSMFF